MYIIANIKTKADAMAFAIEQSGGDLDKANAIYRMFVDNMTLPDTEHRGNEEARKALADVISLCAKNATEAIRELREKMAGAFPAVGTIAPAAAQADTIILPGMPHLEWMTENLKGFGGTEVDGRWYYTYEQAEEAVKQLGNGWRIPTRGEMVDLNDLGSEWQEEGPHGLPGRLFGGGLFLDAAGYRHCETGALTAVGGGGWWWASSSYCAGITRAGYLYFNSTDVGPLNWYGRAGGLSVRCVRNRQ